METIESLIFFSNWTIPNIVGYLFLMIYLIRSDFDNSIKLLFIITFIFLILNNLFTLIVDGFNLNSGSEESFIFEILPYSFLRIFISWFLILVSTLIKKRYAKIEIESRKINGIKRNVGLNVLFSIISGGIYSTFWYFRIIDDLKKSFKEEIPLSAWKAFLFCFIPIFNIFWTIYLIFFIPVTVSKIEKKYFGKSLGFSYYPIFIVLYVMIFSILNILNIFRISNPTFQHFVSYGIVMFFVNLLTLILLQIKVNNIFSESNH